MPVTSETSSAKSKRARKTKPPKYQASSFSSVIPASNLSSINVTEDTAMTYAAVYRCADLIGGTIGSLPAQVCKKLYKDTREYREPVPSHPVSVAVGMSPNTEQSPMTFWEYIGISMVLRGNAYAEIQTTPGGEIYLWPLKPQCMEVKRVNGNLSYKYNSEGTSTDLEAGQVLHFPLFGDGIIGWSPVRLFKQAIGLGMATEGFGASFFGNGSMPSGVLTHPGKLQPEAKEKVREQFEQRHRGVKNSNRVLLLENGLTWTTIGIAPEEAQFLETRKFQITDIARIYGVPPHMLYEMGRATWNNVEQLAIEFVTYTLRRYLVRIEQEIRRKLLAKEPDLYVRFSVDALLRGDSAARFSRYKTGFEMGVYNLNDILELEDRNPIEGKAGELRFVPANLTPMDENGPIKKEEPQLDGQEGETEPEEDGEDDYDARRRAVEMMFQDALGRAVAREVKNLRNILAKGDADVIASKLSEFYADHEIRLAKELQTPAKTAELLLRASISAAVEASRVISESRSQLLSAMKTAGWEDLLSAWEQHRAQNAAWAIMERFNGQQN